MKISYRNCPSLQIYDKKRCKSFIDTSPYLELLSGRDNMEEYEFLEKLKVELRKEIADGVRAEYFSDKPIYYLSPAFMEAVRHALPQMNQLLVNSDVLKEVHEDCVIILPKPGYRSILEFSTNADGTHRLTSCTSGCLTEFYEYDIVECDVGGAGFDFSRCFSVYDTLHESVQRLSCWYIIQLFKKYANVETYLIKAGEKCFMDVDFSPVECKTPEHKAKNEAGVNVIVLDSLWYTTICRDEGFMVRGHFRLQPVKVDGKWTRKIIYISAYEKHGYHRTARVRSVESSNKSL